MAVVAWPLAAGWRSATAFAQRVEGDRAGAQGMYEAEVPVNGQGEAERNAGFARALAQVLGKLSGDRSAAGRPGVGQELRHARDYVEELRLPPGRGRSATGAPTYSTTLVVRFDQERSTASPPRSACRCGRSRGPSR